MDEFKIDPTISYDIVTLPSGGIYYTNKKKSLKVSYLTAVDENILSAPNLLASNTVIEELLRRKILDRDLPIEEIVEEDRQAVLIFLRNTAFGTTYKITATDPQTDKEFSFDVDLSVLKTKDFKLVGDVNDEYQYSFSICKANITFKFLTKKQEDDIDKLVETWNGVGVAPRVTKRLEWMIKSINGNRDEMNIRNFIEKLPIKDSQDFKKFIQDNKPGIDLTQNITTPSGENIQVKIGFGVEFFRFFYGL